MSLPISVHQPLARRLAFLFFDPDQRQISQLFISLRGRPDRRCLIVERLALESTTALSC
jgi:hypothetical protein